MADIVAAELKVYRSATVDDTSSNGGAMDETAEAVSGVSRNVWPTVFAAERAAGSVKWRKVFLRVENSDDKVYANAGAYLRYPTTSTDDRIEMIDGDSLATQGDIVGSEDKFGAGALDSTVTGGATEVDVLVETGSPTIFRDTETVVIADGTNVDIKTISGAPSNVGDVWTVTLDSGLAYGYSDTDSYVSSVIDLGDVEGTFTSVVVTSSAGTFDDTACTAHSIGAVDDAITLTFTSATGYDASGAAIGSLGSGNVGNPFAPTNANTGTPYFTLPAAAWGGTFATSDSVTFNLNGAIHAFWERRTVDAGAAVTAGNDVTLSFYGESADP